MAPRTRYARSGDVSIAYQIVGDGPIDLVQAPPYISHLEYAWEDPGFARYLRRLASFSRLILFDKRGTGLSDRVAGIAPLVERMDDVRAVMDAAGSQKAVLFGLSESTPLSMLFAATYPERTSALVLYGAYASETEAPDYPWAPTATELATEIDGLARTIHEDWGSGADLVDLAPSKLHDPAFRAWFSTYQRLSASPGAVIALARMNAVIDVRHLLPSIHLPTLVVHRTGLEANVVGAGRYVAARIPGARLVELPGEDYLTFTADSDALVDEIEGFVTGTRPEATAESVLATVLVAEIAGSARRALALGDRGWGDRQDQFRALVGRELDRFRGRLHDAVGDRLVATFDGPARAIMAAAAIARGAAGIGLPTRSGLHIGECVFRDGNLGGVTLPLTAWVASHADPGEILVSGTLKDLVAGSDLRFVDRGVRSLGGGAGEWRLHAARTGAEQPDVPLAAEPASLAFPRADLTRREHDVLPLVARGRSNRQIADALSIGERTVESHVASILAKWGLSNRAQLARLVGPAPGPVER